MKIQQIRNATLKLSYGGKVFLIDPWLAAKGETGAFADFPSFTIGADVDPAVNDVAMPLVDLPEPLDKILEGVNVYLLTHLHPDHFDFNPATKALGAPLDHAVPLFVQNEQEAMAMKQAGFQEVGVLEGSGTRFGQVTLYKVAATHGEEKPCGPSCGLVFQAPGEKTLYIAGDTVWYDGVVQNLKKFQPEVIVLNTCCASLVGYGHLIMDDAAVENVHKMAPQAQIVASHMDVVTHATLTRKTLREKLAARGLLDKVLIPEDGETLTF